MAIELLLTTEAAAFLRTRAATLQNWRVMGRGPVFCKIGGRVAYTKADLEKYVEQSRSRSTSEVVEAEAKR